MTAPVAIGVLWYAIPATMIVFQRRPALARKLKFAYLICRSFAVALNLALWNLNR